MYSKPNCLPYENFDRGAIDTVMDFKNINQEEISGCAACPIHNYDYQNIDHLLRPDDVFETPHAENETFIQFL